MSFHESFADGPAAQGPSNRSFGLTVGGILAAIGAARGFWTGFFALEWTLLALGGVLMVLALAAPAGLSVPNRLWMGLGQILFRVVNPLVMLLMYALCIVPAGLAARMFGYDPLKRKFDRAGKTYWIDKTPPAIDDPMKHQF